MNKILEQTLNASPRASAMSDEVRVVHMAGLGVLGCILPDDFFDVPRLPEARFSQDGVFYSIPYGDSEQVWLESNQQGKTVISIVVYRVYNRSSECPLRIDFTVSEDDKFSVKLFYQLVETPTVEILCEYDGTGFYTTLDPDGLSITKLMALREQYVPI